MVAEFSRERRRPATELLIERGTGRLGRAVLGLVMIGPLLGGCGFFGPVPQPYQASWAPPYFPPPYGTRPLYSPPPYSIPATYNPQPQPEPAPSPAPGPEPSSSRGGGIIAPPQPAAPPASEPTPAPVPRSEPPRQAEGLPACGYWRLGGILWPCERQ